MTKFRVERFAAGGLVLSSLIIDGAALAIQTPDLHLALAMVKNLLPEADHSNSTEKIDNGSRFVEK